MVTLRVNSSIKQLMAVLLVVDEMWKRKGYLEKYLTMSRIFLPSHSMMSMPVDEGSGSELALHDAHVFFVELM